MKKKDILKRLNVEMEEMTPDMSQKLRKQKIVTGNTASVLADKAEKQRRSERKTAKKQKRKWSQGFFNFWHGKRLVATVCAFALVCVCITAVLVTTGSYTQYDTYISMSVNPSFDIVADSKGKVQKVIANNYEAQTIAQGGNVYQLCQGKNYSEAVAILTQQMVDTGYLTTGGVVSVGGISSRGDNSTQQILTTATDSVNTVAQKADLTVVVNSNALSKQQLTAEAQQVDGSLGGDATINQAVETLSGKLDYLENLRQDAVNNLGEQVEEKINSLYRMQLLEKYLNDIEVKQDLISQMDELNEQIASDSALSELYKQHSLLYLECNGWWLKALDSQGLMPQSAKSLLQRFERLIDRALVYNFYNSIDSSVPNVGAVSWSTYALRYQYIDVGSVREWVEQLKDAIAELTQTAVSVIDSLTEAIVDSLGTLAEDCNTFLDNALGVDSVEEYVDSILNCMTKEYDRLVGK